VTMSSASRKSLGPGLTSITNPSSSSIRRLEMVGGSNMMCVVDYLPQSSLIGKTPSMISPYAIRLSICLNFFFIRVCANIRNGADGFSLANKYFLTCLYPTDRGDRRKVEQYFLRSQLLLKVSHKTYLFLDFTFPSVGLLCYLHITILGRWIRRGNRRWASSQEKEDSKAKESHQE